MRGSHVTAMRMIHGGVARTGIAVVIALAFVLTAHATAPGARADCDGGFTYETAVAHAHGAIVGVIAETTQDSFGFVYATAVTVERAVGVRVGQVFRGRAGIGLCSSDFGGLGSRVVVLLGVRFPDVPGGPWDVFYTVGQTVTPVQVARLAGDLPDTATAPAPRTRADPGSFALPVVAVGLALVALRLRYPRRRPH